MKSKSIATAIVGTIAGMFSAAGLYTIGARAIPNPLALIEYPEKQLIGLCLCAAALWLATRRAPRRIHKIASIYAIAIGLFTFTTKLFLCFFSEDGNIAGWHWITTWTGALLILLIIHDE